MDALTEDELDSTASTPPSPVLARSDHTLEAPTPRTEYQTARITKSLGASRRAIHGTSQIRGQGNLIDKQSSSRYTKSSPVKVTKHLKVKRRRSSRVSSDVWNHFTPQESEEGPIAVCNYCHQVYICNRATHGTSTLRNHLMNLCKLSPFWDPEKRRKLAFGSEEKQFSIEDCRTALAKMIIQDEMPFSVVEGEGFKNYSNTLEPRFEVPSRITTARDCLKIYYEEKEKLKKSIRGHRICLTTDTWTSVQNLNYMCLTAHWIDHGWKLQKRILNFCLVPDHKGDTLGEKIEECLLDWDIGHIFTLTADNATSNDSAISYLKTISKDWEGVILKNEFLHIRCCAHIVNLIVKSGLKYISSSITKIRNVVRYVRSSPGRSDQFKRCIEKEKISDKCLLSLDVETRWNATYLMLESAVKFEKAFNRLAKENKSYSSHFGEAGLPTALDWEHAREFISVLEPFNKVTERLSGSLYVTSSRFFHDFFLIHTQLVQLAEGNNHDWSAMAACMKAKFDKYWGNVAVLNPLLFMAVALDPRFKLKYLAFCSKRMYGQVKAKEFVSAIEEGLTRLFDWYVQAATNSSHADRNFAQLPLTIDAEWHGDDPSRLLATQFAMHLEEIESRESDSELSRFLKDTCEKNTEDFEILTWWKVNSNKYPILSKLAKDVLAVPVSTVASESAFSTGGRVISSFRSSLSPKMAEVLICAQSRLRSSPKKLDMREIIKDLQNCEALEEEFADLNSGDLNSFSSMDTRSYPLMGWQSHGAAVSTCFLSIAADQFKFPDVKTSLAYDGPPAVGSMPQLYQEDASIKPSMGFAHCIAVSLQKHILQFVPIFGDIGD
ncbi:hypothetical protein ACP70R_019900 [Stipagrostis hirtigluma subsp. patula]